LVGKNEKSHTAQSRFLELLKSDKEPSLEEIQKAFDIETITKEFFKEYRDLFIKTKLELDKIVKENPAVRKEFEDKNISTVSFAKKLLGQIVFLYFLQKKGWFGVEKGKDFGTGPRDFIRRLFNGEYISYKNFYNEVLEPLFYEALRVDRSFNDHYYDKLNCKIPFLNGGLFDPPNDFNWVDIDLLIPNELFSNEAENGILDVFDRYNFTVNEEEPLEKEVALDPELLGKIYEKLNAIREDNFDEYLKALKSSAKENEFNKEYGVYYTPREIVHYMCSESLIYYLESQLDGKVSREDLEVFVNFADLFIENEKVAQKKAENGNENTKYKYKIPESIIQNAEKIDKLLDDLKICDPAVGSGAFPVGMLHEIVKLRQLLSVYTKNNLNTYDLKRHTIENSIYGVDIDSGAIEVCKLRFWLSLVVDEESFKDIKPLPNLDYKIVRGNSLIGFPEDWRSDIGNKISELESKYFSETHPDRKKEIKKELDALILKRLENSEGVLGYKVDFDFRLFFPQVFKEKGGFDIVIGNPPHGADIKKYKNFIENHYKFYETRKNSASLFIEKGFNLLKEKGILSYVIPKSITYVDSWERTRKLVYRENKLLTLIDISKAFENVRLEQVILISQKIKEKSYIYKAGDFWDYRIKITNIVNSEVIEKLEILPIYIDEIKLKILEKLLQDSIKLYNISETFRGLPFQRKISDTGYPILRGKNINKYQIYREIDKVKLTKSELNSARVKKYMRPKIISQNIVAHVMKPFDRIIIMATYDKEGYLTLDTVMNTFLKDKSFSYEYILGILNSRLAEWFYYWFVYNRAIRTMHFDEGYLGKLPIKKINSKNQPIADQIIQKVDQILSLTQSDDYDTNQEKQKKVKEIEKEIDMLVYELYGLDNEEIEIIESSLNSK
jgi:hypothetical protein